VRPQDGMQELHIGQQCPAQSSTVLQCAAHCNVDICDFKLIISRATSRVVGSASEDSFELDAWHCVRFLTVDVTVSCTVVAVQVNCIVFNSMIGDLYSGPTYPVEVALRSLSRTAHPVS
jgi:hypothetical protein